MAFFTNLFSTPSHLGHDAPVFSTGIKVWHDPETADVDLVFVHGLTGDLELTWTHEAVSEPWPKSLLPIHLPSSRTLTFGYDAYVVQRGAAVSNQLVDHSRDLINSLTSLRSMTETSSRPLIFVGHSLGGLVCKDAILQSRNNPEHHLQDIFNSTIAIAFVGTPHGGSDLASWANIPAKTLGVLKSVNTDLLSVLRTSSEVLYRIQTDFLSMVRHLREHDRLLKITCFWESLPMPHFGIIVPRSSASLAGYNAISIHANHRDMVRFSMAEDPGYVSVVGQLKIWAGSIRYTSPVASSAMKTRAEERKQQRKECLKSLTFVEIESRISNIDTPNPGTCEWIFGDPRYISWTDSVSGSSTNILWIKGKPGSGKSILMKHLTSQTDKDSGDGRLSCFNYFFNARGANLEKSALGLYRKLVFQLLRDSDACMEAFLPLFLRKEQQVLGERVTWQAPELSEFFHSAILTMGSRPIYIFIDALDECEEDEVRRIVKRFDDSSAAAVFKGAIVKLCFLSRHYPHIGLQTARSREIYLENHNKLDIRRYVHQELSLNDARLRKELGAGIVEKSVGMFLWSSLMVRRLLKAFDQGRSGEQMKILLCHAPPSLESLFKETLSDMGPDRQASIALMAPWVVCALRPLTLYELYISLAFSVEDSPSSLLTTDREAGFDKERFRKYLIDTSGGLFETVSINGDCYAQVIHESVRDFFVESEDAANLLRLPRGTHFVQYSHELIIAASGRYLNVRELRQSLPLSKVDNYVAIEDLVDMLYKPITISSAVFSTHYVPYIHDFIFFHVKKAFDFDGAMFQNLCQSDMKRPRTILERWLVFLYYTIIQRGALSAPQSETLDLLDQNTSMLGLDDSDLLRLVTAINNLIIFVNKTMKDGFVLDKALCSRTNAWEFNWSTEACYLRLFWRGPLKSLPRSISRSDFYDGNWQEYGQEMTFKEILQLGDDNNTVSELIFALVPWKSKHLKDLERCWTRRGFPSCTVPLRDWRVIAKDGSDWFRRRSNLLASPLVDYEMRGCVSMMVTRFDRCRCCLGESFFSYGRCGCFFATLKSYSTLEGLSRSLPIGLCLLEILAIRNDWELPHYPLKALTENAQEIEQ